MRMVEDLSNLNATLPIVTLANLGITSTSVLSLREEKRKTNLLAISVWTVHN